MWIVILGFCVVTLLLAWLLFGYVVWLRLMGDGRKKGEADLPNTLPRLSVIVPCLNEEAFIAEKYRNLTACEYPRGHLEIVFADGGSTDGTVARLESLSAADPGTRVVACPAAGKISQLNHVLPMLSGDIVVVTDADARLEPEALMWLAADLEADPKMAVVGAFTSPNGGIAVERCYWAAQNRVRVLESRMSHVSTIAACCYAFRRELLNAFPDDVVADDVYVAALANTLGYHSTYSVRARVEELRTPASLPEFFSHKFRKGNAVLREMLRFAYRLPEMPSRWKSILATRIVQHFLLPWGTLIWLVSGVTLINLGQVDVVLLSAAVLMVGVLATRKATLSVELPPGGGRYNFASVVLAYCYMMVILIATALTYPFFRQTSCYARLAGEGQRDKGKGQEDRDGSAGEIPASIPSVGRLEMA